MSHHGNINSYRLQWLVTCCHGNIAMQMAVDYSGLPAHSHAQMHIHLYMYIRAQTQACANHYFTHCTLGPRYIPYIGCIICGVLIIIYDKKLGFKFNLAYSEGCLTPQALD